MKNSDGYTLMEIMLTAIVLGVLASLAIPNLSASLERVKVGEGVQVLDSLLSAQRIYFFENGAYTEYLDDLDIEISAPANFDAPSLSGANANEIASIKRETGGYTLCINSIGVVSCDGSCDVTRVPAPVDPATCSNS